MKKFIGSLMLFGTFAVASAQTITFDKTTIDYGTVPVNADGNRVFNFKNTGDKPLILSNVQPGCGCTASEWPKEPILPGKSAQIKVHYNTANAAPFKKSIDVFSNDPANGRVVLYIQGTVDPNAKAEVANAEKKNPQASKEVKTESKISDKEQEKIEKAQDKADKAAEKAQKKAKKAEKAAKKAEKAAKKAAKATKKAQESAE